MAEDDLIPRDETHDSIDRNTGALTLEAQAKRRAMAEAALQPAAEPEKPPVSKEPVQ